AEDGIRDLIVTGVQTCALPISLKPSLLRNIVRAAVQNAQAVPVTIKFRMGINLEYLTFLTAGRVAEDEGCAAVGLHARTAAQLRSEERRVGKEGRWRGWGGE